MEIKIPNPFWFLNSSQVEEHNRYFKTLKAKANARRTKVEKIADWMTARFGSMEFLLVNALVFLFWIAINAGMVPVIPVFDPFPFNLLTMGVSLEAIFLAVVVLISQNRAARVDDVREETHLQINLIAEREITKVIGMLASLMEKNGIDISQDPELKRMLRPVRQAELEKKMAKEMK